MRAKNGSRKTTCVGVPAGIGNLGQKHGSSSQRVELNILLNIFGIALDIAEIKSKRTHGSHRELCDLGHNDQEASMAFLTA